MVMVVVYVVVVRCGRMCVCMAMMSSRRRSPSIHLRMLDIRRRRRRRNTAHAKSRQLCTMSFTFVALLRRQRRWLRLTLRCRTEVPLHKLRLWRMSLSSTVNSDVFRRGRRLLGPAEVRWRLLRAEIPRWRLRNPEGRIGIPMCEDELEVCRGFRKGKRLEVWVDASVCTRLFACG